MALKINPRIMAGPLLVVLVCVSVATAQQDAAKPPALRVVQFRGDMAALLAHLAGDYRVTIGLEADPKKPQSEVTIDLRDATLTDILNGIVQSEPRYQWRESGGDVEVFPVSGRKPLLDNPVINFQLKDVLCSEAIDQLMSLPEVQAVTMSMNLKRRPDGPLSTRAKDEKFSLSLSGVTLTPGPEPDC
jgi:hypothetical protein